MTARDEFLRRIARSLPDARDAAPLPDLDGVGSRSDDCLRDFVTALEAAAGRAITLSNHAHLEAALGELDHYRRARRVCSLVPGVARHNVNLSNIEDPRSLSHIDVAVMEAALGVAENGAVWLSFADTMKRALLYLSEHVVVLLEEARIVDNMHRAYEALDVSRVAFGCFVSGPSKTADIEQALVIGAHGPRSLTVVMI